MFSALLERLGSTSRASPMPEHACAFSESVTNAIAGDHSGHPSNGEQSTSTVFDTASVSSTPPTSVTNTEEPVNEEPILEEKAASRPTGRSSQRTRTSVATYNVKVLTGTAIHAPKKYNKPDLQTGNGEARRRTISGETLVSVLGAQNISTETIEKDATRLVRDGIDALDMQWSARGLPESLGQIGITKTTVKSSLKSGNGRRKSTNTTRSAGEKVNDFTKKLSRAGSNLGQRGRQGIEDGLDKAKRELRRLADTNEFAKIETQPVLLEVWSNGKLVTGQPPPQKNKVKAEEASSEKEKAKPEEAKPTVAEVKKSKGKRQKVWLNKGLYAGQQGIDDYDWFAQYSAEEKERKHLPSFKPNSALPLPMWHGQRLLHTGRDFKLPFDICSPLPPGQAKPENWNKTTSNRFIGASAAAWKKSSLFDSFSSKCVCKVETGGCQENCQNKIMLYECDDGNCGAGRQHCSNRPFADLQERRKEGGRFRIGVEVIKTADRGFGVRSNRGFEANQIIVEYTGEIITEDECDRRMNEDYKDNDCYYLMSFDQNMIIDATKGSIARFVNHSCKPNCRMVKWIVGGKPRMALFAGDHPISTADELTYDYNFDPFSAKNVQECRCGSVNCRGFLGPRPKDQKFNKENTIKEVVTAGYKAGKRKLQDLIGGDDDEEGQSAKKRKIKTATGIKRSASSATMRVLEVAQAVKKSASASFFNTRSTIGTKKIVPVKKDKVRGPLKTYGRTQSKMSKVKSRSSSLTVAASDLDMELELEVDVSMSVRAQSKSSRKNALAKTPRITKAKAAKRAGVAKSVVRNPHRSEPIEGEDTIRVIGTGDEDGNGE